MTSRKAETLAETVARLDRELRDLRATGSVRGPSTPHVHSHSALSGVTSDQHHPKLHAADHLRAGADKIDGDLLDVDYSPSSYTRTTGSPGSHVEHLAAHLRGIDAAIAAAGGAAEAGGTFTPVLRGITSNPTLGTGSVAAGVWHRRGSRVHFSVYFKVGTSPANGSGLYYFKPESDGLPSPSDAKYETSSVARPHPVGQGYVGVIPSPAPVAYVDGVDGASASGTSHTITFPATLPDGPGTLVIVALSHTGNVTTSWPAGWNEIVDFQNASGGAVIAWKLYPGTVPASIVVTTSAASAPNYTAVGYSGVGSVETGTTTGTSGAIDPPSKTASAVVAAGQGMWVAVGAGRDTGGGGLATPSGYTARHSRLGTTLINNHVDRDGTGSATANPGAVSTNTGVNVWAAATLALLPESAALRRYLAMTYLFNQSGNPVFGLWLDGDNAGVGSSNPGSLEAGEEFGLSGWYWTDDA